MGRNLKLTPKDLSARLPAVSLRRRPCMALPYPVVYDFEGMNHYPPFQQGAYGAPPERGYSGSTASHWGSGNANTRQGSIGATGIPVKVADGFRIPPRVKTAYRGFATFLCSRISPSLNSRSCTVLALVSILRSSTSIWKRRRV